MAQEAAEYVQKTAEDTWRIADSRVSLASLVHAYWEGNSPEAIVEQFPTLSSEQVYGAIAFYLRNKTEIDQYLMEQRATWEKLKETSRSQHGPLLDRLRASRKPRVDEGEG